LVLNWPAGLQPDFGPTLLSWQEGALCGYMMRLGTKSLYAIGLLLVASLGVFLHPDARGEDAAGADFKEVYDLIRTHLVGVTPAQLDEAAVQGLVSRLAPQVALVTNGASAKPAATAPLVSNTEVFDSDVFYVRVGRVGQGLATAIRNAWSKSTTSNKLKGVVLDLRYTEGRDYGAVAPVVDLFVRKQEALLNWGKGMVQSEPDSAGIRLPVAVLANKATTGAAEALAAVLRETGNGLILGSRTAGQAMVTQEFPLKNGSRLRIATAPVQLGDGSALSEQGVKPDIEVEVSAAAERVYYENPYALPETANLAGGGGMSATNQPAGTNRIARRPRFNEAELVRERREGISEADLMALRNREPEKPTLQDPTLARAVDLLRGLALVRESHP